MRTVPLFSTIALLGSLIAVPPAYAHGDFDGDWEIRYSRRDDDVDRLPPPPHHHSFHKIERNRTELQRDYEERRRVWKAYEAARHARDWRAVEYHRARLDRLDRKIQHDRHELERAYAEARREHDRRNRY